jgi:alpha-N-acetylglucosamine transferase
MNSFINITISIVFISSNVVTQVSYQWRNKKRFEIKYTKRRKLNERRIYNLQDLAILRFV